MEELYDLCEALEMNLEKTNEKLRKAGGELSGSDLEYVDKLTHSLKSIKAIIAMTEGEDGYSGRNSYRDGSYRGGSYRDGGSYDGGSYRGRGRTAKRDSMGRYSREGGYSRADDFRSMLSEVIEHAPNSETRERLHNVMQSM